jgi:hypothetical protein
MVARVHRRLGQLIVGFPLLPPDGVGTITQAID